MASDDVAVEQARLLLRAMYDEVAKISHAIQVAEDRRRATSGVGTAPARAAVLALRRELYEAHRLIDGLHHRFPETAPRARRVSSPVGRA